MNPGTDQRGTAVPDDLQLGSMPVDLDHIASLMMRMAGGMGRPEASPAQPAMGAPSAPPAQMPSAPGMAALPSSPLGMGGGSHPAPFSTGVNGYESVSLPGNDFSNLVGAALLEGYDPTLVSLDLLPLHQVGRPIPGNSPRTSAPGSSQTAFQAAPTTRPPPGGVPEGGSAIEPAAFSGRDARLSGSDAQDGFYFLAPSVPRAVGGTYGAHPHAGKPVMIRDDFPILQQKINGHRLVWLDSAATTQKPNHVIETEARFYRTDNSNVHRGAHTLAKRATDAYEAARQKVRRFIGAGAMEEIIFVRSCTEGMNLIAQSLGRQIVGEGDEVLVSHLEHHSNIVPWQMLCAEKKAKLRVIPVDDRGELLLDAAEKLIGPRTRIVSVTQVANVTGTLVPIAPLAKLAHRYGAKMVVDGAQSVAHIPVDVSCMDCDFYVFSGHKIYAPTGIGAVYGRLPLLESMPPWQGGGSMIQSVSFEETVYMPPPAKFEAGTGHFAGAVGLGAAIDYLEAIGMPNVALHEQELMQYAEEAMRKVNGLRMIGRPTVRIGALPFIIEGRDNVEVAQWLDKHGIAVRAGHHCAQPILARFGLTASVRASLGVYSAHDDIDALVDALRRLPPAK